MIIRIVRLHFRKEHITQFLEIFGTHREDILASPGCQHLQLFHDLDDDCSFVTISHWDDEQSLEDYRKSALFKSVWGRVKNLFAHPSSAFSVRQV